MLMKSGSRIRRVQCAKIPDGVNPCPYCDMTAYILWEMTFFCFSEDDTPSFMDITDNEYERRWSGVWSRQRVMYARGREEIAKEPLKQSFAWAL